jgi:hypothetical protein
MNNALSTLGAVCGLDLRGDLLIDMKQKLIKPGIGDKGVAH